MDTNFEVGTLVRLKSGGPTMTATAVPRKVSDPRESIYCEWFSAEHQDFKNAQFPAAALVIVVKE